MNLDYPMVLKAAKEGGFNLSFPDVPEALTQAEDKAEALVRGQDALETALGFYVSAGKALPVPSKAKRHQVVVQPCPISSMKLAVYAAMRENNVKKTALARQMGWHLMQVDRLLDLNHTSRLDQLEAALRVFGKKLSIKIEEAA